MFLGHIPFVKTGPDGLTPGRICLTIISTGEKHREKDKGLVNIMRKNHLNKQVALLLSLCLVLFAFGAMAEGEIWPTELDDRITEEGMWITWRVDEINDFYAQLGYSAPLSDQAGVGQISKEEAIRIARDFILQHVTTAAPQYYELNGIAPAAVTESFLDSLKVAAFLTADNETENAPHCWQVHFYADEWLTIALDSFSVQVDALTGDIVEFFEPGGNG